MKRKILRRRSFVQTIMAAIAGLKVEGSFAAEEKLEEALKLLESSVRSRILHAASIHVRQGERSFRRAVGEASEETPFLIASITKPLTAAGMMLLVDRNELQLSDPVYRFIPEFSAGDRKTITIRHLLTHTSGLPDQLPENVELRQRHAPLSEFVERAIRTPLLFKPGREVRYQSMGFLLAAEVAQRITLQPFREYLRKSLFLPMGMVKSHLGLGPLRIQDTALNQVEQAPGLYGGGSDTSSWNWNSRYWRDLGVPWGGAHSTGADLERFLRYFLHPEGSILSIDSAQEMVRNQNESLGTPWGLGFMVQSASLGQFCSPAAFGHSGSTGTLCWADPKKDASMVLLTTLPARVSRRSLLEPVSDLVGAAFG
jgi:CubicO group peptidase (beta-lactamase class C family)